jgi:probable Rubsico expression protein CbbX
MTHSDEKVDLAAECTAAGLDTYMVELDQALIGLAPVKQRISEIASLLLIDRVRHRVGLVTQAPTLHMSFTGNPGTGKTTVARTMAEILHRLGYLRTPRLVSATRDDLVGEYIGHTAPKTKAVLQRAMGGVLFIDEAYYLHRPENGRDYGQEAIEILLQVMEDRRDDLVIILAGYRDRMDRFFGSNPGFRSRVAHHIEFPDYTDDELVAISERLLADQNYRLSEDGRGALGDYLALRREQPLFANARSVRNALDRARLRQANRHLAAGLVSVDDLSIIEGSDFRASRVFQASTADELICAGAVRPTASATRSRARSPR